MRYYVAAGTRHYREAAELPLVHEDITRAADLFESMGYERILKSVSYDPESEAFENALADWCRTPGLSSEDIVVVYYAGHGDRSRAGQYRLACADSEAGRPRSWLSLPNLAEILATSPVRNVLFVVDACHAAAAAAEIGTITDTIVAARGRADVFGAGTWLLASARHRDLAVDGAFVTELAEAHRRGEGPSQRFLAPSTIAERVNNAFRAAGITQRAACSSVDQSERPPFFVNPSFDPRAEVTDDGRTDADASDLSSHFEPRGRGVEHVHDPGSYFTGRERALHETRAHLAGETPERLLVVTADPGSGKSAVLGRLVLEGHAEASVNAHHQTLEALVGRIAAAADVRAATAVTLFTALAEREQPFRIVVDSLDEAGAGGEKTEARRIAWDLLRPLAAVACVRLVVGSRRELLPHLGDRVPVIDLDDDRYCEDTDSAEYVAKIIGDTGAPYRGAPDTARRIAAEVARRAGRCFLVARMTASALLRGPVIDTTVPGWAEQLPSDVGGAFDAYLQRLPSARSATTTALLTALAFGEGNGLPRRIWIPAARRLSGLPITEADVDLLVTDDESYLARARVSGTWYFRLYHQELTDHIKSRVLKHRDLPDVQECLVEVLSDLVPERNWERAHPYVRAHLATHAAAAGLLDDLIEEASFVVHAEPSTLLPAVRQALRNQALVMAVERYTYLAADTDPSAVDRAALLAFVAETYAEDDLARAAEDMSDVLERVRVEPRYITPHRVVGRHDGDAYATRSVNPNWKIEHVVLPDGRRVVLAAPPQAPRVHVWLLDDPSQSTVLPHPAAVVGLVVLDDGKGRPEAVTLDVEGTVRTWDVTDQSLTRTIPSGETILFDGGFRQDGTPVVVCGNAERVAVFTLPALHPLVEVACLTSARSGLDEPRASARLAHDGDGRVHLLLCDCGRGRVTLHALDGGGEETEVLSGLTHPVLTDSIRGERGTVAAICESRIRMTLCDIGSGRTVPLEYGGFSWQEGGFALGSAEDPVLVAQEHDDLLVARLDGPEQRPSTWGKAAGHASVMAPVLRHGQVYAATVGDGNHLTVVDCATGDAVGSPLWGHEGAVCALSLLPVTGDAGPDILAVGNDGTARLWRWGDHEGQPGETLSPSEVSQDSPPEIESLIPWSHDPTGVMAVTGHVLRRVAPAPAAARGTTHELITGVSPGGLTGQDVTEDPDGTLHLLSWEYTGHGKPEIFSDLPGWPLSVPESHAVWHRLSPGAQPTSTHLDWLQGRLGAEAHILPPTRWQPRSRVVALDAVRGRAGLLDAPDAASEWTDLPWTVDPSHDYVCSAAFTTLSGDPVVMTGTRRVRDWESSVGGRSNYDLWGSHRDATQPGTVTAGRLWHISADAPHGSQEIELAQDICLLLPHHDIAGTRWVAQQGRDGSTAVIDLTTDRRYTVNPAHTVARTQPVHERTLVSGVDFFLRWAGRTADTAYLLFLDPAASDDTHPAPVTVWDATAADTPRRLAVPACRILWSGPAPNGETLVAVSDAAGVALCHLPSGEKVWSAPLPALVTALTALPGSSSLDLAVGTQQGVVFVRPRLSRRWRGRLGVC